MSVPDAWGLKYQEVVGLAWLAYKGKGDVGHWRFPNAGSVWNVTRVYQVLNFRAVLVEGEKKILSYSGTDDLADWGDNISQGLLGASPQYLGALALAKRTQPDIVVGHSLGGGLASYVGIYQGKHTATVNPAALNINPISGIPMILHNNRVINYVVRGEVLDLLDRTMPNMRRIGKIHHVPSNGSSPIQKHSLANLSGFVTPVRI